MTFPLNLRYGLRRLLRNPGFAVLAVLSLALGIGANTAVFSLVDAAFLRPWPVQDPSQLVVISTIPHETTGFETSSYPDYLDIRSQAKSFAGVAAHGLRGGFLVIEGRGRQVAVDVVSDNYFAVLGLQPAIGRFFSAQPGTETANRQAVVLSYALWQRRFGSDPSLPGRTVALDDKAFTVLGVAPKGFLGLDKGASADIWVTPGGWSTMIPGAAQEFTLRRDRWLDLVARLAPGATLIGAQAELGTLAGRLSNAYTTADKDVRFHAVAASERARAGLGSGLFLLAMVGLVLLIACANVANLLLAQTERRRREIAVRQALGAGRRHLLGQLLTESLVLAAIGGALGLVLAWWLLGVARVVPQLAPIQLVGTVGLDTRALLFTAAISLLAALVFGLAPGLQSSRFDIVPLLKGEEPRLASLPGRLSLRGALVAAEIALSVILLVGSGLLLRSLQFSERIEPGFDPHRNVVMLTMAPAVLYGYSENQAAALYPRLIERLDALPGVVRASYGRRPPLSPDEVGEMQRVALPGETLPPDQPPRRVRYNIVSAGFFGTFGTPIVQGRDFGRFDTKSSPRVVIINQTLARQLWPDGSPVGRHLRVGSHDCEVIGVVEDGRYTDLHEAPEPYLFLPFSQVFSAETVVFVQTARDPRGMVPSILNAARSAGGSLPAVDTGTLSDYMGGLVAGERASATLLGGLSVLGIFLAIVGLYGVIASVVSRQTHDIGIRMALGARPFDVLRLTLGQGVRLAWVGAGIGLAAAVPVAHLMAHRLYGVTPTDVATYAAAVVIAVGAALVACWIPAWRAATVDPATALRHE